MRESIKFWRLLKHKNKTLQLQNALSLKHFNPFRYIKAEYGINLQEV